VTQNLLNNGDYIYGQPLKNWILNGDGRVGYAEAAFASPVRGHPEFDKLVSVATMELAGQFGGSLKPIGTWFSTPAFRKRC